MKVKLIRETSNPVKLMADIASICYGKDKANNPERLVRNLLKLNHSSVFEHVYFTWKIEGVSRALLGQLTRHRHASYTVRSQRYCNEKDQDFIVPESINNDDSTLLIWTYITREIKSSYDQLIKKGVPKEDARFILPQATETELYFSCNLRELLHIYKLRSDKSAQWEIRELARLLKNSINPELHFMFGFTVGDVVKVVSLHEDDSPHMERYIGRVGTIMEVHDTEDDLPYYVRFEDNPVEYNGEVYYDELYFSYDELEKVE